MGKSQKKKRQTVDFQKVKLKVGKRKPVGTNVTNTSFRTSTIHIANQLESGSEPVNRKNLSLKSLLLQLNHYNVNMREEALHGLRDLFQTHPHVMHEEISLWLSKVLAKITDPDAAVRHALHLCVTHTFKNVLEVEVSPFFKETMAHICCGLTHLKEGVRLDTLDILGILLSSYPTTFILHSEKVIKNVLDLISKHDMKANQSQQKGGKAMKGIYGLVNQPLLDSADTDILALKSRTKILERLYQILKLYRQHGETEDESSNNTDNSDSVIYVSGEKPIYVRVFKYGVHPEPYHSINPNTWLQADNVESVIAKFGNMESLILSIFPVILNIWVECEPKKLSTLNDSQSSRSLLSSMKIIVDILDILLDPLQNCDQSFDENIALLFKSFSKELLNYFLNLFVLPLNFSKCSVPTRPRISQMSSPDLFQQFSVDFNILMAKIICALLRKPLEGESLVIDGKQRLVFLRHLTYFISLIVSCNTLIVESKTIDLLMIIIDNILCIKNGIKSSFPKEVGAIDIDMIFKQMLEAYENATVSSLWRIPLIKYFSKYICEKDFKRYIEKDSNVLQHMREFTKVLITAIWSVPVTSNLWIKESLNFVKKLVARNLADNEMKLIIAQSMIDCTSPLGLFKNLDEVLQRCMMEIIYHVRIPNELLKNLAQILHLDSISVRVKKYMISLIGYSIHRTIMPLDMESYVSFILTAIVGFTTEELHKFNADNPKSVNWSIFNVLPNKPKEIPVDYAISQLDQFDGMHQALGIVVPAVGRILCPFRSLPLATVSGLLRLLHHLSERQGTTNSFNELQTADSEINQIADFLCAVLLYSVSKSYNSMISVHPHYYYGDDGCKYELMRLCIDLLKNHTVLLRLLIKKIINILGEYRMNGYCVNSLAEVLIALLQENSLALPLRAMKYNIHSVVSVFIKGSIPAVQQSLIEDLQTQVLLL